MAESREPNTEETFKPKEWDDAVRKAFHETIAAILLSCYANQRSPAYTTAVVHMLRHSLQEEYQPIFKEEVDKLFTGLLNRMAGN